MQGLVTLVAIAAQTNDVDRRPGRVVRVAVMAINAAT
jgi:hypothetical protein